MAGTQINQNQINLGSETAIDLLTMQNGWKKEMITAMNNKIVNYASDADTMNTVVQKFMGMTGSNPDTVYKIFKSNGNGTVRAHNFTMPKSSNDSWEITVCRKMVYDPVFANDTYGNNGIGLNVSIEYGSATLYVPVYNEDDPTTREYIDFSSEQGGYSFVSGTKYWFKVGYSATGKYYAKVSTNGSDYTMLFETSSSRKADCDDYLWFNVSGESLTNCDILYLKECKVVIDGQTVFDGDGNITISNASGANADITWQDGVVYMPDVIQL